MVELRGIGKYFSSNGVTALNNACLTLRAGEIHALLGENGTGKSTLMHILAGYLSPSSGTILVDGKERRFAVPADALALGIGMVKQHPGYVRGFKVWEDCILGAERAKAPPVAGGVPAFRRTWLRRTWRGLFLDPGVSKKRVEELSNQWHFDLPLEKETETLTVSQRQKAAVLALLLKNVKWFIFDEPTAVLTPGETESLFELFRRLRDQGRGIIFITHKLDEVLAIANRVTVIRRGATQPPLNTKALSADTLRAAIFGDLNDGQQTTNHEPRTTNYELRTKYYKLQTTNCPPPLLTIKDLAVEAPGLAYIRNVNLRLTGGRILGIAGVRDSGLETLELAVSGLLDLPGKRPDTGRIREPRKFEGSIALNGREIAGKGVRAFREAGGAYLGADRLGGSLAPEQPLKESLIIHAFRRARRAIFLDMAYLDSWCMSIMRQAGIERSVSDKASSFSGGMLQRILLAREFAENASLIVLSDPGSGLDQQNQIRLMEELKSRVRGRPDTGALLFSTDMEELISTADEIMVLRNGTITGHFIQNPPGDKDVPDASGSSGKNRVLSAHELRAGIIAAMAGTVRAGTMQENHGA